MAMDTGEKIKAAREQQGLTQKQLAARMHVCQQTISNMEVAYRDIRVSTIIAAAKALDVPASDLLPDY